MKVLLFAIYFLRIVIWTDLWRLDRIWKDIMGEEDIENKMNLYAVKVFGLIGTVEMRLR